MKEGDKLYCIKISELRNITLDKCYDILEIKFGKTYNSGLMSDRDIIEYKIYFILNDLKREDVFNEYNIFEYFVTPQEYRKLKLKKLNESR
jgi:hypothetical protein